MAVPQVVIVGRPNVGKSSIFNWLANRRIAIVDPASGVTRDRVSTLIKADDRFFELVDTGGMGIEDVDRLTDQVEDQIEQAIELADVIVFVVDGKEGITPLDQEVAKRLRYVPLQKPVILVANKCDTPRLDATAAEFYKLGRGKMIFTSVEHNRNRDELLQMILARLPETTEGPPPDAVMKLAVVGKRNAGKSTFINCLAQAERMIVSEVPGTTRDAVDVRFEMDGKPFLAIDTAGIRRKKSIGDNIDFYSIARAERSIRRADVVLLFIDPTVQVSKVDKQLAHSISAQFKPCIFVVNKWDLMGSLPLGKYANVLHSMFPAMAYIPIAFVTAQTGKNVKALINHAQKMFKQANLRVGTSELNRVLREALEAHPPAMQENRRPKIYFGTQVAVAPPTIVLFCNAPRLFDATYQRYLLNVFRERLPFHDIPIKLYLRQRRREDVIPPEEAIEALEPDESIP